MSELQLIQEKLARVARRRRISTALRRMWQGLAFGAAAALMVAGLYHLFPLPDAVLYLIPLFPLVAILAGFFVGAASKPGLLPVARWVDDRLDLKQRLGTALEMASQPKDGGWRDLVISDAAAHVGGIDAKQIAPFHLPKAAIWGLTLVALTVSLGFVPEYRSKDQLQREADRQNVREVGRQLAELTRRSLEQRSPALEPAQRAMESAAELGDKLGRATLERKDALKELTSVSEKMKEDLSKLDSAALRKLEQAARAGPAGGNPSAESLQKQIDALQKQMGSQSGDPKSLENLKAQLGKLQQTAKELAADDSAAGDAGRQKLADSLASLSREMRAMGMELPSLDEAVEALAAAKPEMFLKDLETALQDLEKMADLAKTLAQLQQKMERMGRDLAEQLRNGQADAARATLEKMVQQLQSANLGAEQMQQMLAEVSKALPAAAPYGKVAEHLAQGAKQLQSGAKSAAADSLAAAAKELKDLMGQLADAQMLMAELEALRMASACIGTGQGWGRCSKPGMGPGKNPGAGVGTWADEGGNWNGQASERWDNSGIHRPDMDSRGLTDREVTANDALKPSKVTGQFSPGGQMPSITLKGVSLKGQSSVDYKEAVSAAQSEAQSALNQDKVPQAYRNAVREYFSDLNK